MMMMRDLILQVRLSRNDDSRTVFEDRQRHHWHPLPISLLSGEHHPKMQAIVPYPDGF